MAAKAKYRGHSIIFDAVARCWVYEENGLAIGETEKHCVFCHKKNRADGHDACLGFLSGVMNACCGHGVDEDAYVQLNDKSVMRGEKAILFIQGQRD